MPSAFRYSGRKYNDALLALGNLRIGTLHDFRRIEHKKGIADANEGKKQVLHHIPYATTSDVDSIHLKAMSYFNLINYDADSGLSFENLTLGQDFDHPDCFVHCTSADYSHKVMRQFEGADSCVEIFDVKKFYLRLTETLNFQCPVRLFSINKVEYTRREEVWNGKDWGTHPAMIKEPEFSKQVEVRAIWLPKFDGPISPIVINDIELTRFCRHRVLQK